MAGQSQAVLPVAMALIERVTGCIVEMGMGMGCSLNFSMGGASGMYQSVLLMRVLSAGTTVLEQQCWNKSAGSIILISMLGTMGTSRGVVLC